VSGQRKPPETGVARIAGRTREASQGRRVLRSEDLLQGQREVLLEHQGEYYTLRRTSSGKLILTK
jgi:hemin uptake protein HemP